MCMCVYVCVCVYVCMCVCMCMCVCICVYDFMCKLKVQYGFYYSRGIVIILINRGLEYQTSVLLICW